MDITITRQTPGIVIGKDGTTHYGTDPSKPWGSMMHAFWPRCSVSGTILTQGGPVDFAGKGLYIHALQGMKPHHAAARWNFCNFQSDKYSAVLMEFTTPPSYGTTKVAVGILVADGKVVYAGADNAVAHTGTKQDSENAWPEPTGFKFEWDAGKVAVLEGPYGPRLDRIDVMAEVPGFVKTIVATAAGTKPYIYQVCGTLSSCIHYTDVGHSTCPSRKSQSRATARPARSAASCSRKRPLSRRYNSCGWIHAIT